MLRRYVDERPVVERMKVRPYDKVAALLVAMLIMAAVFDGLMYFLWLAPQLTFNMEPSQIEFEINIAGRGDHAEGYERDKEPPGAEELQEFMEPEVELLLEAVTDAVSTTAAAWDSVATNATNVAHGSGAGDSRPPGPLGEGEDIVPEWERWEIKYNTSSINAYARQLDFFKIELGAVGGGHRMVDYASNLAGSPKKRQGTGDAEDRIYFTWTDGTLKQFDTELLVKAGIPTARRIVCQFIPKQLRQKLLNLEARYAAQREGENYTDAQLADKNVYIPLFKRIGKTIFGVKRRGASYEFYVIEQRARG